jgi:hypothetical protein
LNHIGQFLFHRASSQAVDGLVTPLVRDAMRGFFAGNASDEAKVVVALRVKPSLDRPVKLVELSDVDVLVDVEPLHEAKSPVTIEFALHGPRANPTVKHADWITERKQLEQDKRPECNEVRHYSQIWRFCVILPSPVCGAGGAGGCTGKHLRGLVLELCCA